MPELCLCSKSQQPRIFFTFCLLLSVVIILISIVFFYYPDGVGLSTREGYDFERPLRSGIREFRGKSSYSTGNGESLLNKMDIDDDVMMVEYGDGDYHVDHEGGHHGSASSNVEGRIRHHGHHHMKVKTLPLEEVEEKSFVSNVIETRLLHLDLKGAPPKVSYLKEVMKLAKQAGINGILLEWEDTFPWKGSLSNLSLIEGGYSADDVEEMIDFAERTMGFDVIPLIQTFGHAEFILKGPEFRHLREIDESPQSFCPSKTDTMEVIKEMVDQILEVHKNTRFIHIGCDEVYSIGVCPLCTEASEDKEELFLKHVINVAKYVRSKGRIPIVWDDLLRSVSLKRMNESGLGSLIEPMVWVYAEDIDRFVGWEAWEKYSAVFPSVWGAGAFKGAFGESLSIPPLSRHAENVERWVDVIVRESPKWNYGVGGIVLTGWMRYDHFSVLCELLPAAIPSLIYDSLIISVPSTSATVIKNRVFVPKSEHIEITTADLPTSSTPSSSSSAAQVLIPVESNSTEEILEGAVSHQVVKRSPPNTKRKIPHPRILMAKDRLSKFSSHGSSGIAPRDLGTAEVYDKGDRISREFCRILHCPNYHTRLDTLIKGSDGELSFATRCNFPGVAFFRVLFRARSTVSEAWETVARIQRQRGWATPYNVRHNYSLPQRVEEVVFSSVPRIRRQLEVVVKSVETSLRPIFRQEIILEWIEQNIWEAWKALQEIEKSAEILRSTRVWARRPVQSPWEMVQNFKLSRSSPEDDQDEL